jgi:hypothetical protein
MAFPNDDVDGIEDSLLFDKLTAALKKVDDRKITGCS